MSKKKENEIIIPNDILKEYQEMKKREEHRKEYDNIMQVLTHDTLLYFPFILHVCNNLTNKYKPIINALADRVKVAVQTEVKKPIIIALRAAIFACL